MPPNDLAAPIPDPDDPAPEILKAASAPPEKPLGDVIIPLQTTASSANAFDIKLQRMSDDELWAEFNEWYSWAHGRLVSFLMSKSRGHGGARSFEDAEDIVQDFARYLWPRPKLWTQPGGTGEFKISKTVRDLCSSRAASYYRKGANSRSKPFSSFHSNPDEQPGYDPLDGQLEKTGSLFDQIFPAARSIGTRSGTEELHALLEKAFANLPLKERIAIELRFFRGLTMEEVAAGLGVSAPKAREILRDAFLHLRNLIDPKC